MSVKKTAQIILLLLLLLLKKEKFYSYKYIHSTHITEFQHNLLQITHQQAGNNYKDY